MGSLKDWGQALRLSMGPSAAADAAAGMLLGAGLWPAGPAAWVLIAGSLAVYHGGMLLNDWRDRQHDAKARPERPLPSGRIAPGTALTAALFLLIAGPLGVLLMAPSAGLLLAGVALGALVYDLWGRGPWLGPLLLGFCRAGNMGAGLLLASGPERSLALAALLPLVYGAYVFVVSRLGRLEDGEDRIQKGALGPRALILYAALLLLSPALLPLPVPIPIWARLVSLGLGLFAAQALLRAALGRSTWEAHHILPIMGMALRRLLVFSASVAWLAGSGAPLTGALVSAAILLGYPLSHRLRRLFPPS